MQLKPEEISKVIRSQIKYYENAIRQDETGTVLMVGDGIARVSGLANCMAGELLEFEDGSFGMAQNLEENSVSVVLFGSGETISEEQMVKRTGKVVSVPVGETPVSYTHLDVYKRQEQVRKEMSSPMHRFPDFFSASYDRDFLPFLQWEQ